MSQSRLYFLGGFGNNLSVLRTSFFEIFSVYGDERVTCI